MKAKQYFDKYELPLLEEARSQEVGTKGPAAQIFIEFFKEINDMIKVRNIQTDHGLLRLVDEQNNKWNAVCNHFIRKYGVSPLKRDGFAIGWKKQIGVEEIEVDEG